MKKSFLVCLLLFSSVFKLVSSDNEPETQLSFFQNGQFSLVDISDQPKQEGSIQGVPLCVVSETNNHADTKLFGLYFAPADEKDTSDVSRVIESNDLIVFQNDKTESIIDRQNDEDDALSNSDADCSVHVECSSENNDLDDNDLDDNDLLINEAICEVFWKSDDFGSYVCAPDRKKTLEHLDLIQGGKVGKIISSLKDLYSIEILTDRDNDKVYIKSLSICPSSKEKVMSKFSVILNLETNTDLIDKNITEKMEKFYKFAKKNNLFKKITDKRGNVSSILDDEVNYLFVLNKEKNRNIMMPELERIFKLFPDLDKMADLFIIKGNRSGCPELATLYFDDVVYHGKKAESSYGAIGDPHSVDSKTKITFEKKDNVEVIRKKEATLIDEEITLVTKWRNIPLEIEYSSLDQRNDLKELTKKMLDVESEDSYGRALNNAASVFVVIAKDQNDVTVITSASVENNDSSADDDECVNDFDRGVVLQARLNYNK